MNTDTIPRIFIPRHRKTEPPWVLIIQGAFVTMTVIPLLAIIVSMVGVRQQKTPPCSVTHTCVEREYVATGDTYHNPVIQHAVTNAQP